MFREGGRVGRKIDAPIWGLLYKEEDGYLFPWSVTDPYYKMNLFT